MKIVIFGASGSGTTTLGKEMAELTDFVHLDADDFYWKRTETPFTEKVPITQGNEALRSAFDKHQDVVVSGSLVSWGKEWETSFDLAVFIHLENGLRMERLRRREYERHGEALLTDKARKQHFEAFMKWAHQYDDPNFQGRSLHLHNEWIQRLDCEVLRLDGGMELSGKVRRVIAAAKSLRRANA